MQIDTQMTYSEYCRGLSLARDLSSSCLTIIGCSFFKYSTGITFPNKALSSLWRTLKLYLVTLRPNLSLATFGQNSFYLHHFEVIKFNLTSENITTNFQPFQFCLNLIFLLPYSYRLGCYVPWSILCFHKVTTFYPDIIFHLPNPPRCNLSSRQKKCFYNYNWRV